MPFIIYRNRGNRQGDEQAIHSLNIEHDDDGGQGHITAELCADPSTHYHGARWYQSRCQTAAALAQTVAQASGSSDVGGIVAG